jgi:hypothetical protein
MATISKLKVGQELWDKHRVRAGNTTMMRWGVWRVVVKEIDPEHRWIIASWNGNTPRKMYENEVLKLRVKEPQIEHSRFW